MLRFIHFFAFEQDDYDFIIDYYNVSKNVHVIESHLKAVTQW